MFYKEDDSCRVGKRAAFDELRNALTTQPVLTFHRQEAEHEVHTDANALSLASILLQWEEKTLNPIMYFSRIRLSVNRSIVAMNYRLWLLWNPWSGSGPPVRLAESKVHLIARMGYVDAFS